MNEFEEFARQFRERTTARLLEFEQNLAQAQRTVEEAARNPRNQRAHSKTPTPANSVRRGSGQVRSVLRRGEWA
ncbi:hypothetical protein [Corynebacterium tapiri]|uniref:hypothetical protein n=1 Tax=Corynebacterium tapiri TaxID=1448266 RepID=UPI001FE641DB|nr:hypothetical protein [Corynebacterium tapiri]